MRRGQKWGYRFERVWGKPPSEWRSKGGPTRQSWGDALPEGHGCLGARLQEVELGYGGTKNARQGIETPEEMFGGREFTKWRNEECPSGH